MTPIEQKDPELALNRAAEELRNKDILIVQLERKLHNLREVLDAPGHQPVTLAEIEGRYHAQAEQAQKEAQK